MGLTDLLVDQLMNQVAHSLNKNRFTEPQGVGPAVLWCVLGCGDPLDGMGDGFGGWFVEEGAR